MKKAKLFAFERLVRHGLSVKKKPEGRHQARHVRSDPYVLAAEGGPNLSPTGNLRWNWCRFKTGEGSTSFLVPAEAPDDEVLNRARVEVCMRKTVSKHSLNTTGVD